jgi:hypothetical protein
MLQCESDVYVRECVRFRFYVLSVLCLHEKVDVNGGIDACGDILQAILDYQF